MGIATALARLTVHRHRLPNGLTVLVREERAAPVVAIVTHVRAGYFHEPDEVVGVSHVLEHMYFKGTGRRGVGEIARETKAAGGYLNAATSYDRTCYYTVLPASALELGLDIQSDALLHAAIDAEELRRELEVIVQEARRKLDDPRAVATESLYAAMFDAHRMRRWRIGTEEELRRLTRDDVVAYYRAHYRAGNVVLSIMGDVDADRTLALVERFYGSMPAGAAASAPGPEEPPRRGLRVRERTGDVLQAYIEWGWRTPGTLHPDTAPLDVLAVILGQGRASRLHRGVREAGHAASIGASNYTPTELGVFGIGAETRPEQVLDAIRATWHAVLPLLDGAVEASELERARNVLEARLLRRLETAEGQARLLAAWEALGDWRLALDYHDRAESATPAALRDVAARYLDPALATILVYRPAGASAPGLDAGEVAEILAGADASGAVAGPAPAVAAADDADEPAGAPAQGTLPGAPAVAPGRPGRAAAVEDGVHVDELPNGWRVAVKPRRGAPLISASIVVGGGALHETRDAAGLTGFMARVSLKGTATRTAGAIAGAIEWLGGAIVPTVGPDRFGWSLTLPSRHFAEGFTLLADTALRPAFAVQEVEREREVALQELASLPDDMFRYPLQLFMSAAFPEHPYGFHPDDVRAAIAAADPERLRAWHARALAGGNGWVVVVGDVDPGDALRAIARELGELPAGTPLPAPAPPRWPDAPRRRAERRGKAQTALVLGIPGPARNDPDAVAMQLIATAASGLGGRFFDELRERRALAYNVAAMAVARCHAGAFLAYVGTSPEREEEARSALLAELERLANDGVTAGELARAQEYVIGAWKIRTQTNAAQLAELADALVLGRGMAELREFESRVRDLTPADLRAAFERHFHPDLIVEGVVRGEGPGVQPPHVAAAAVAR